MVRSTSIVDRNKQFEAKKQQNLLKLQKEADKELLFKPTTNQHQTADEEIFDRLYKEPKVQPKVQIDPELTFKPKINELSQQLAANRTSIIKNSAQYQKELEFKKEQLKLKYNADEERNCTFKPQITEFSRTALPHYRFDQVDALQT